MRVIIPDKMSVPFFQRIREQARRACGLCVLAGVRHFGSRRFVLTNSTALVVAPHPDDETLGCGGLIALKRAQGTAVHVVILTDGGDAPTRRTEALAALTALGVHAANVTFLGGEDGSLASLDGAPRASMAARLAELLTAQDVQEVFLPHRADVHSDHEAAYRLLLDALAQAGSAATQWQYAIWLLWWKPFLFVNLPPGHLAHARYLTLGEEARNKKRQAIACHTSQLTENILPRAFLARFSVSYELFFGPTD